jgi:HD-GYP domain-containing protein (c-di-GMP phosphodiesterase class II)
MALAEDDPYVERLIEDASTRKAVPLSGRELRTDAALGVVLLGALALLALVAPSKRSLSPLGAAALVAAYALTQLVRFDVGPGYTAPSQLVFVPMLVLAPPALVPVLVAASFLVARLPSYLRGTVHPTRLAFVLADSVYALGPALVVAVLDPGRVDIGDWPVFAVALVAQAVCDAGVTVVRDKLSHGVPPKVALQLFGWVMAADAALTPVGMLARVAAQSEPLAIVFVLPLLGLFALFARERHARIEHALALSNAYRGTALLMSDVLEADDAYTGGEHSHGVVAQALAVGDALGLDGRERRNLEFGALLHDVGKIRVADEIINKPGKLTEAEWALIKRHPVDGQEMLERVGGVLADVGLIVRHHHERWDGGGYPDGIAGTEIPLAARIICACDAYSAMTTNRSYRAAMPVADAIAELRRCSGTQFDPAVVDALVEIVAQRPEPRPARALIQLAA